MNTDSREDDDDVLNVVQFLNDVASESSNDVQNVENIAAEELSMHRIDSKENNDPELATLDSKIYSLFTKLDAKTCALSDKENELANEIETYEQYENEIDAFSEAQTNATILKSKIANLQKKIAHISKVDA